MSVQVNYKGSTIATIDDGVTKTLNTAGTWVEGDITVQDTTTINSLSVTPSANTQTYNAGNTQEVLLNNFSSDTRSISLTSYNLTAGDTIRMTGNLGYFSSDGTWHITKSINAIGTLTTTARDIQGALTVTTSQIEINDTVQGGFYNFYIYKMGYINGYAPVTVSGDSNLIASNIKSGVSIFGVTGNYSSTVLIQDSLDANGGTIRTVTTTEDPIYLDALSVTTNGTYTPTTNHYYSSVNVNVIGDGSVALQAKTNITPTESSQTITPDSGYNGLSSVQINAISSTYVGSGITQRSSSSLTASGATVTVPAGYYAAQATKSISSGTASAPTSITGTSASVSTGTNTLTLTKTVSVTPVVSAGYISSGTATNSSVSLTASITTKAAATITPTTSNQTIAAGTYLTGIQTIAGDANLLASNIKNGVSIFGVTGSYTGASVSLQEKTGISPTESSQTITPDSGYNGLSSVQINAISSTYVGTGITRRSSTDLTASGATVTVPAGYYSEQATKSVTTMTLPTSAASSATSGYTSKATISRSTSAQYINIPAGYNSTGAYYTISAVANGSATAPSTISGTSATVSTGTNTLTLTKTISITPTVSAGYISAGTAGNSSVSLTASVTTKAAATYNTSSSDQTIAASQYLTGAQTIRAVTTSGISAANIKAGVTVNVGDSADADRIIGVTGTFTSDADATATDIVSSKTAYVNGSKITGSLVVNKYYTGSSAPAASLGSNGDIYLQE